VNVVAVEQLDLDGSRASPPFSALHLVQLGHVPSDLDRRLKVNGGHVTDDVTHQVARGGPQEAGVTRLTRAQNVQQRRKAARIDIELFC